MSDDIIVQDREELIYLLCEAAEFEHTVMCTYLYAQWTLKRDVSEGVTPAELAAIERWRRSLAQVALEEMLHLSLVNNLLAAIGAAPHLWRPAFPVRPGHFPADVVMDLRPFSEAALDHFMFIERPEGILVADGAGFAHGSRYRRLARPDLLAPSPQDYASQGHLYHGVLQGLVRLAEQLGEERIFVGHGQAQVSPDEFGLPGLFRITDLASARRAVEEIVLQGEGAPAHRADSHFARFSAIRAELGALRSARPTFAPARPVVQNPILGDGGVARGGVRIVEPVASRVVDLGNSIYTLMIRALSQVFAPAPLPRDLRASLATSTSTMMSLMVRVGELATRLPAGTDGLNAGLNFELPGSSGPLVQQCAARILGERASELAGATRRLSGAVPLADVAAELDTLSRQFEELHVRFESPLGAAVDRVARVTVPQGPAPAIAPATEVPRASSSAYEPEVVRTPKITIRFDGHRCIHARHCVLEAPQAFVGNSTRGNWIYPEAVPLEQCVHAAHNCPSGGITYERHDGGPQEAAPSINIVRVRENGPYAIHASMELNGATLLRTTLCRCGQSKRKPWCDGRSHGTSGFSATGEPVTQPSEPLPERAGHLRIEPVKNGPLRLSGNVEILSGTGRVVLRTQSTRLCRCGASANKPFCDGSHARIGFRSED